jgi:hypothetical protein
MKKISMFFLFAIIFCNLISSNSAMAENASAAKAVISGKVMILGGSEKLEGAVIDIDGNTGSGSVYSLADGTYTFETESGDNDIRFSAFGYKTKVINTVSKPGQKITLNVYLDMVDFVSDVVVVKAKKDKNEVIKTTIKSEEIKKIPGTAGDALRAVQTMPGVAATSDFSSGLAVQGGGPADNLYLLDGIPWPFPFHFGGILSTVYSGLLSSVDLNTAGFGAQWGGVMGTVLDAKTRPGAKDGVHGDVDLSMITSQALLEAPIGIGDASVAVYGRRSYIDLILGKFMAKNGFTVFPFFWDMGGSIDFTAGGDNHFKGIALANDDMLKLTVDPKSVTNVAYSGTFGMDNGAFTGGFSWTNTSFAKLTSKLTSYYYNLFEKEQLGQGFNINMGQADYGIKEECEWEAGNLFGVGHALGIGASLERIHDNAVVELAFDIVHQTANAASTDVNGWHTMRGGYLQDRMSLLPGLAFTAGVRYDKDEIVSRDTTLPRFCLSWQSDPLTVWKAAWGGYSQYPTDIQLNDVFGNPDLTANLAQHLVAGVERKLTGELTARVDAYYKYYNDLVISSTDAEIYDNSGSGIARGVELYLNADYGEKFFGWISYALSRSERLTPASGNWVLYQYDQTNLLTAVGSYSFTPAWSAGLKVHYNSGPLVKKLLGSYQDVNGDWHGVFSPDYEGRLDDYLRLDLRTDYTFRFEGWKLNLYVEILNLLNRPNPASIMYSDDYTNERTINNLPFMPYLGLEAQF